MASPPDFPAAADSSPESNRLLSASAASPSSNSLTDDSAAGALEIAHKSGGKHFAGDFSSESNRLLSSSASSPPGNSFSVDSAAAPAVVAHKSAEKLFAGEKSSESSRFISSAGAAEYPSSAAAVALDSAHKSGEKLFAGDFSSESGENLFAVDFSESSRLLSSDAVALEVASKSGENLSDHDPDTPPAFSWRKLWRFTGPGFLMSIAFLDPGNLEGDLQAGAIAGYSLLWLLLWATVMGLLIQLLSARVGVATGKHLAELCREEYPRWARWVLWVMAEVALIGADIQEVIGSAIAIQILSRGVLPLWAGVVITASDCFVFLFLENYGVRKLEAVFAVLIGTMALSFAWMFGDAKPSGRELVIGVLVPKLSSKTIRQAVGVVGCVIMPHNVFLHSALVQSRKVDPNKKGQVQEALNYYSIESTLALLVSFVINLFLTTVFAKGFYGTEQASSIGLVNAGQYLEEKYGGGLLPILYIWGIGLLSAGQSSTITGTYAGQFIMGGFLDLRLKKWLRALITRSFAIVPTMIVALVFNSSEATLDVLNEWLNVLQSIQIPFALIPLLTLVSKEHLMGSFRVGPVLERISWTVAALVIVINGYLLMDFFTSEVNGILFGLTVCVGTVAYVTFILYLVLRDGSLSSTWYSLISSKNTT